MILFFQRARAGASFSSFPSFSFSDADLMRAILFYEERSGRGRVLVRENLPLERDEFALYARIGNAQNERSRFCSESFEKKEKGVPALSKSLHARALSHGEREEARGEKTVEIYRVPLLARVRVLFIRASSFFFRACVRFVCARLVLRTFFFPVSKTRDIFRFSFCFLGETAQKGEMPNEKEGTKCGKKEGVFFCFLAGKICLLFCPKAHRHESSRSL